MPIDEPVVADDGPYRSLRFSRTALQSRMYLEAPDDLVVEYTRTMVAFVLFAPAPAAIGMIGLGGGSLARYCLRYLPASRFVAVEVNPKVVALRASFGLPPDDDRFSIVCADGARWVSASEERVDVLMLDAFTSAGIPRTLRSRRFYDHCHSRLNPGGVLAANFWAGDPKLAATIEHMRKTFDGQVVGIRAEDPGHRIVFALKDRDLADAVREGAARAEALQARHPVDLVGAARKLVARVGPPRGA